MKPTIYMGFYLVFNSFIYSRLSEDFFARLKRGARVKVLGYANE